MWEGTSVIVWWRILFVFSPQYFPRSCFSPSISLSTKPYPSLHLSPEALEQRCDVLWSLVQSLCQSSSRFKENLCGRPIGGFHRENIFILTDKTLSISGAHWVDCVFCAHACCLSLHVHAHRRGMVYETICGSGRGHPLRKLRTGLFPRLVPGPNSSRASLNGSSWSWEKCCTCTNEH